MAAKGIIALMGSGELTSTMVEVHKSLLSALKVAPRAVFLDTPAGFQLNVNQLSERAEDYFKKRVGTDMQTASLRSNDVPSAEAEEAFQILREAGYVLVGPGSPTYAVHQWRETPVPDILQERICSGGCLVAASAAALTVGRFTLPVYEIYKVGSELYWEEGLDTLGRFGFDLVVIPHWNNAEGGTHDTRFCYMGESRFRRLEDMLPEDVGVLGLDEHTACLIDLARDEAQVEGIGTVTLRRSGREAVFHKGDRFPLDVLRNPLPSAEVIEHEGPRPEEDRSMEPDSSDLDEGGQAQEPFWDRVHRLESDFQAGLAGRAPRMSTAALLELDRLVWEAAQDLENPEFISQAREILREFIVFLGQRLEVSSEEKQELLTPLVESLLDLRERFRQAGQWDHADAVRDVLQEVGVVVEDSSDGPHWHMKN
jgi:peptidase E